jgi:hypothetical protein
MRLFGIILVFGWSLMACNSGSVGESASLPDWSDRVVRVLPADSLIAGSTYLSVYSQIYGSDQSRIVDLSATVSIRNTNQDEPVYLKSANYYNTSGELTRAYAEEIVQINPLETVEIFIDERNKEGGTGANFIFEWFKPKSSSDPLFEAVMISTSGQQGISFTTRGIPVE